VHPVVVICVLLVLAGAIAIVRWNHLPVTAPWADADADDGDGDDRPPPSVGERVRRAVWWIAVHHLAALATAFVVVGPGARLVMRLLAVTAGDDAQGRVTEADELVGRISVGGTIGLVIFGGVFGAGLIALAFGLLRKWLPSGRLTRTLAVAGLLAVTAATTLDPLRPDNPDFDLVGPDGVSVAAFAALLLLGVFAFAAFAGRIAAALPVLAGDRPRTVLPYAPLLLLLATGVFAGPLLAGAAVAIAVLSQPALRRAWADRRVVLGGRLALAALVLVRLPAFVGDLTDIL
jgi:hypothetical protein